MPGLLPVKEMPGPQRGVVQQNREAQQRDANHLTNALLPFSASAASSSSFLTT